MQTPSRTPVAAPPRARCPRAQNRRAVASRSRTRRRPPPRCAHVCAPRPRRPELPRRTRPGGRIARPSSSGTGSRSPPSFASPRRATLRLLEVIHRSVGPDPVLIAHHVVAERRLSDASPMQTIVPAGRRSSSRAAACLRPRHPGPGRSRDLRRPRPRRATARGLCRSGCRSTTATEGMPDSSAACSVTSPIVPAPRPPHAPPARRAAPHARRWRALHQRLRARTRRRAAMRASTPRTRTKSANAPGRARPRARAPAHVRQPARHSEHFAHPLSGLTATREPSNEANEDPRRPPAPRTRAPSPAAACGCPCARGSPRPPSRDADRLRLQDQLVRTGPGSGTSSIVIRSGPGRSPS
jgi:hypothetical protein